MSEKKKDLKSMIYTSNSRIQERGSKLNSKKVEDKSNKNKW